MPLDTERGDPAPLGLVGFGLTTVLLSIVNAGLLPSTAGTIVVIPLAMAFGGTIQFFAGLLEFRNGNTFGTVAFSSYGAFWWWFALLEFFGLNGLLDIFRSSERQFVCMRRVANRDCPLITSECHKRHPRSSQPSGGSNAKPRDRSTKTQTS
jgi:succinate-acetate transporter protein